jgi:vitamin B12 transporter
MSRSWSLGWALAALTTTHGGILLAEEAGKPVSEVVVTATRVPTPRNEILAPVLVIDRETIERSTAADAAELLRFHAGLEVARNGGPGQTTAVFIRGADSNHTLVLVDGVRINPGTIGLAALQNIAPQSIERIEVVKGPRSALYGSDAIGGVINIITRRGSRDGWVAELGYGSYETTEAGLTGGFAGRHAELDVGLSWIQSSGFPTRTTDDRERGYENLNATMQLRTTVGQTRLAFRQWYAGGTSEYSDFFLTPVDQDFVNSTTSAEARRTLREGLEGRLGVSYFDDEISQNQSPDYLQTRRSTIDGQLDWAVAENLSIGAGLMYSTERASSESYGEKMKATTDIWNLYLENRYANGPHHGLLALGLSDHETAGNAVTWNLEYGYDMPTGTRLYGLAGTGFRAPDASDRFGYGGNPALQPERSQSFETGIRQSLADRHSLALSVFHTDIKNLIEFVTLSYDPFAGENRNVGHARIQGIEAAYDYRSTLWNFRVEAIYQNPENLDNGEQLLRRARESLTVSAFRRVGPFEVGVDVLAVGDRKDFGFPEPVTLDSYVLTDLIARWQVSPSLQLLARLENAFDEAYELASTFNTAGRGLYVTLRYAPPSLQGVRAAAQTSPRSGRTVSDASVLAAGNYRHRQETSWDID